MHWHKVGSAALATMNEHLIPYYAILRDWNLQDEHEKVPPKKPKTKKTHT